MHFGLGESAARRMREQNMGADNTYVNEKPDDWKAQDGPLPSIAGKLELDQNENSPDEEE